MQKVFNDECPKCGEVSLDYESSSSTYYSESVVVLWYVRCPNCGCHFHVKERYSRTYAVLTYVEGEDENA